MKIIFAKPPIYDEAQKLFKLDERETTFFTYGDTCYSPAGVAPDAAYIRHEETHADQQAHNDIAAKLWWQKYIADPEFRAEQEIQAYGEQYKFLCQRIRDRNQRFKWLHGFAKDLAGPMYASCVKYSVAVKRIRDYAEGKDLVYIEELMPDVGVDL